MTPDLRRKLALATTSVLLTLVACEQGWRTYAYGWRAAFTYRAMDGVHDIGESGLVQASSVPEIVYELRPGLRDITYKLAPFATSSLGLHDREYAPHKPPGTFRVVVLGDSFTMPAGVALDEAYHTRIEDRLNESQKKQRYEVVNFGVAGYDLRQDVAVLEHRAMAMTPDLVLVGFCGQNDYAQTHPDEAYGKPYQPKPEVHTFFRSLLLRHVLRSALRRFEPEPTYGPPPPDLMAQLFARLKTVAGTTPVLVAYLDNNHSGIPPAMVRTAAEGAGLRFVDASAPFEAGVLPRYRIYRTDTHPNGAANAVFADVIYEFATREKLIPLD